MNRRITDTEGVATYLATSPGHIRRLRWRNQIPSYKVGGLVRFDLDAIDKWLADNFQPVSDV